LAQSFERGLNRRPISGAKFELAKPVFEDGTRCRAVWKSVFDHLIEPARERLIEDSTLLVAASTTLSVVLGSSMKASTELRRRSAARTHLWSARHPRRSDR
jgi:ABC-type Fe3+ transport system permease subunit